jgi:hypothetical protein
MPIVPRLMAEGTGGDGLVSHRVRARRAGSGAWRREGGGPWRNMSKGRWPLPLSKILEEGGKKERSPTMWVIALGGECGESQGTRAALRDPCCRVPRT